MSEACATPTAQSEAAVLICCQGSSSLTGMTAGARAMFHGHNALRNGLFQVPHAELHRGCPEENSGAAGRVYCMSMTVCINLVKHFL